MKTLSELFEIKNGMSVSDLIYPKDRFENSLPVCRPSNSILNIIDGFIARDEALKDFEKYVFPKESIIVSLDGEGSHTYSYLSQEDFIPNSNVAVLVPKDELTKNEKLFYSIVITKYRPLFNYGRKPRGENLGAIKLPEKHEMPQWVSELQLDDFTYQESVDTVELNNWTTFKVSDLFDVVRGKSEPISDIECESGLTPIVSSSERNNGVSAYSNEPSVHNQKCLTLAINGSVGACFYQETPFIATADVAVLVPNFNIDKYKALFISTLLKSEGKLKWSYGRKWDVQSVRDTEIKLPSKNKQVDWDSIVLYMSNIEMQFKIENKEANKPKM